MDPQKVYLGKIVEAITRAGAAEAFLREYASSKSFSQLDSAVLQTRKALEAVAFAAIAPNKDAYQAFRQKAAEPADYRKDYNARKILLLLEKINPDFYPIPLLPPQQTAPKHWHFDKKKAGFLSKKRFERFYDRLGKFLHADNPWDDDKGIDQLLRDLPRVLAEVRELLALHKTVVRTPTFSGVWILEILPDGSNFRFLAAYASGDFAVTKSGT